MTEVQRLLRPERNWHAICLLGFGVVTGAAGLTPGLPPNTIEQAFPPWMRTLWYAGLIVAGVGGLVGYNRGTVSPLPVTGDPADLSRWLDRVVTAMTIERASMLLLSGLCAGYVGTAVIVASDRVATALGVSYVTAFALASLARSRQLRLKLQHIRERLTKNSGDNR